MRSFRTAHETRRLARKSSRVSFWRGLLAGRRIGFGMEVSRG